MTYMPQEQIDEMELTLADLFEQHDESAVVIVEIKSIQLRIATLMEESRTF